MQQTIRNLTLDHIRVVSTLLRCVLHTAVPYMVVRTGMWPLKERNGDNLLPDVVVYNIHSFIMESLFLLAGYLMALQIAQKGLKGFWRNRARYILIPFLAGLAVLIPYIIALFPLGRAIEAGTFQWPLDGWYPAFMSDMRRAFYPLAHLWFLYYLLYYYLMYGVLYNRVKDFLYDKISIVGQLALMWAIAVGCLAVAGSWYILNPLSTTVEPTSLVYFLLYFHLGLFAYHRPDFWTFVLAHRRAITWAFVLACALSTGGQYFATQPAHPLTSIMHGLVVVVEPLHSLLGALCLAGWAQATPRGIVARWVPFLTRSAYWVYLLHLPLVMTFHLMLYGLDWPLTIKYLVALGGSVAIAMGSYVVIGKKLLQ